MSATVAALAGELHAKGGKTVLIAGGDGKGQDFSPLFDPVAKHVRAAVLIGRQLFRPPRGFGRVSEIVAVFANAKALFELGLDRLGVSSIFEHEPAEVIVAIAVNRTEFNCAPIRACADD